MKFKHLKVPGHWENYWTRFPEGYTILEALINWVSQVDDMIDHQNNLDTTVTNYGERLDEFIDQFDTELQDTVELVLADWQKTGFLDVAISTALTWELDSYKKTNEQDKLNMKQAINTKIGGDKKVEPNDLSSETLGLVTGNGGPINLETVPQDNTVSKEKMTLDVQQTKFFELENKVPELIADNWGQIGGTAATDINGGIQLTTGSGYPYARSAAPANVSQNQTLFVRVKMKVNNTLALRNRVMLRNGTSGYIHFQQLFEKPGTTLQTYYFSFTVSEILNDPMLFIDTIYEDAVGGRSTDIYEATVFNISQVSTITPNVEFINSMTYQGNDLFNAYGVVRTLNDMVTQGVTPKQDYSTPPIYHWGTEYLHSWYQKVIDKQPIKMVWGGDSTTFGAQLLDGYKRNQLGKKIMLQGGYTNSDVTSLNKGHGENTTQNWLDTWLDEDLAENPDLYVVAYGLNDGGSNYFSGTPEQRAIGFESRLRQGLAKIRGLKTQFELPVIVTMPVSTNSNSSSRTTKDWHDIIRPIVQKACRDYECCYVDFAMFQYDRTGGATWSANGDTIHPNRYATVHYMSLLSEVLYPTLLQGDFNITD